MGLKNIINKSSLHREIVRFFHENPSSIDTPRGIATWVRGDLNSVKAALRELQKCGILIAHRASSTTGYSYTRNPKIISRIGQLLNG